MCVNRNINTVVLLWSSYNWKTKYDNGSTVSQLQCVVLKLCILLQMSCDWFGNLWFLFWFGLVSVSLFIMYDYTCTV